MWWAGRRGQVLILAYTYAARQLVEATPVLSHGGCDGNPHCKDLGAGKVRWYNDCGIERPSQANFEEHKKGDVIWLRKQFKLFRKRQASQDLQDDEATFPAWFAKIFAPNHSPSSAICDGLASCIAPSCTDLAKDLTLPEQRRVLLWFDFMAVINHAHHAMTEAMQDFFNELSFDVEWFAQEFSYADELQDKAKEKKRKREMYIAIVSALLLAASAATAGLALYGEPILAGVGSAAASSERLGIVAGRAGRLARLGAKGLKLPGEGGQYGKGLGKQLGNLNTAVGGVIAGGFIGATGLMKEASKIKHGDDEEGFDKFVLQFKHSLASMSKQSSDQNAQEMMHLAYGESSAAGKDLIDLYESGFYSEPNTDLRGHIKYVLHQQYTGKIVGALWKLDGTSIKASRMPEGISCEQDTRGDTEGRVCLEERPHFVYYVQAITHYGDNKLRVPDGMDNFIAGKSFNDLTLEDFVRSALFQDEVWRPFFKKADEPDLQTLLEQSTEQVSGIEERTLEDSELEALDSMSWFRERDVDQGPAIRATSDSRIEILDHYGAIPGAVLLPICYTWHGEAISDINSSDHSNAPCLCDPPAPHLGRPWSSPTNWTMAYTKRFIKESEMYGMPEYGKMCRKHHGCAKNGKWPEQLGVDKKDVVPEMQDAWRSCNHPRGHGEHKPSPKSSTAEGTVPQVKNASQPPPVSTVTESVMSMATVIAAAAAAAPSTTSPPVFTELRYDIGYSTTTVTIFGEWYTEVWPDITYLKKTWRPLETVSVHYYVDGGSTRVDVTTITFATPAPSA